MPGEQLTHLDDSGRARMVDVSAKPESERWARARGTVILQPETVVLARAGDLKKGDLRATAELAGVTAAKRTWELIPLCHPLPLTDVEVHVEFSDTLPGVEIEAIVRTVARTGVEMEALTAVAVAGLTVVDMVKGIDRRARIQDVRLVEKHGGRSSDIVLEA
ncbi:MAG: cyclic pyranopterin monophosphate synthase MoaC [Chloroflexota bacterium]